MKKSILTSFALLLFGFGAMAQTATYPTLVRNYTQVVKLEASAVVTDGGGGTGGGGTGGGATSENLSEVNFAFSTVEHYTNGISGKPGHNFQITSTSPWLLQVKAGAESFTNTLSTNSTVISHNKLAWALATDGTYTPLSTDFAEVKSGLTGLASVTGHDFTVYYKLNPGAVSPDTYSMNVLYTLSVQ